MSLKLKLIVYPLPVIKQSEVFTVYLVGLGEWEGPGENKG